MDMDAEARALVAQAMSAADADPSYGLNFGLLHVSTAAAFLIVGIWRGHQELWGRHYGKDLASGGPFVRIGSTGDETPIGCVWELAAICHERMAWHRYLFSARTAADKRAWLEDVYAGPA
jgi:hypothetical protein